MLESFPNIGPPDWGIDATADDTVVAVQLGDGYESRTPGGINHVRDSWSMTWTSLTPAEGQAAYDWLKPRKNLTAILWINPTTGVPVNVVCKSLSLTHPEWGVCTLSVSLKQDFNPV